MTLTIRLNVPLVDDSGEEFSHKMLYFEYIDIKKLSMSVDHDEDEDIIKLGVYVDKASFYKMYYMYHGEGADFVEENSCVWYDIKDFNMTEDGWF